MKSNHTLHGIRLALASGLVCVGALASAATADPAGGPHGPMMRSWAMSHGGHGGDRMGGMAEGLLAAADELELSDAQRTKLKEIRRKSPAALMPKRQAVMEAQMDYRDLLAQGSASVDDLRRAYTALQKARNEMQNAAFDLRMQAREVLTPEQRDKLRETMKSQMRRRGPGRMGEADSEPFDLGDAEVDEVAP